MKKESIMVFCLLLVACSPKKETDSAVPLTSDVSAAVQPYVLMLDSASAANENIFPNFISDKNPLAAASINKRLQTDILGQTITPEKTAAWEKENTENGDWSFMLNRINTNILQITVLKIDHPQSAAHDTEIEDPVPYPYYFHARTGDRIKLEDLVKAGGMDVLAKKAQEVLEQSDKKRYCSDFIAENKKEACVMLMDPANEKLIFRIRDCTTDGYYPMDVSFPWKDFSEWLTPYFFALMGDSEKLN